MILVLAAAAVAAAVGGIMVSSFQGVDTTIERFFNSKQEREREMEGIKRE